MVFETEFWVRTLITIIINWVTPFECVGRIWWMWTFVNVSCLVIRLSLIMSVACFNLILFIILDLFTSVTAPKTFECSTKKLTFDLNSKMRINRIHASNWISLITCYLLSNRAQKQSSAIIIIFILDKTWRRISNKISSCLMTCTRFTRVKW